MLNKLDILNFRGIRNLSLEDFSTVNIFVGRNGAGKTSVLEACALAADPLNIQLLTALSSWRELPPPGLGSDDAIRTLFPDLDTSRTPTLVYETSSGKQSLRFSAVVGQSIETTSDSEDASATTPLTDIEGLGGLRLTYSSPQGNDVSASITLQNQGYRAYAATGFRRELGTFFIHARRLTSAAESAALLTRLYERKKERMLLELLRKVDKRVLRLQPGLRGRLPIVLVDLGDRQMIPMNMLGDGFCRICLMLTGILWDHARVTAIDEIDSGLHYSLIEPFWRNSAALLRQLGHQLFCVTHSDEMLMNTLEGFEDDPDALRIFRLERDSDGQHRAKMFTYEAYKNAALQGAEIR